MQPHTTPGKNTNNGEKYIHENPSQEHWCLCRWPEEYKYSSASFYHTKTDLWGFLRHYLDCPPAFSCWCSHHTKPGKNTNNGEGRERVYIVEPTGIFENDPNVTNQKFPGNPTRSYRTLLPLRIVGEVTEWARTTPEEVRKWREKLAEHKGEIIN